MAKSDNGELNRNSLGSNDSDLNNSLLKKVTKRVSGLFPSSLTKWFGPSEGHQSVIRRRESIEEEDDEETIQIHQPPKKRAKPSSDIEFSTPNNYNVTSTPLVSSRNDLRHLQPSSSGYARNAASSTSTSTHYESSSTRNEDAIVNGDDKSESGNSTTEYASICLQQHKDSLFTSDRENTLNQPSTSRTSPNNTLNASLNSSRSLFSDQSLNSQRRCLSSRRPAFSASTFGSPSFVDRTLSTKRAVNSPFYSGRTMYGGAAAYRRNRLIFPRDEANNIAVKNSIEIKPVKESTSSNDSVNLSKTARRILDALEHFSTPVLDAKKIPSISKQSLSNKSLNQRKTPYARENKSASNKELLVPTVPDLLKMKLKERLQDSTVQVRKLATNSKSVLNTEYSIPTVEETAKSQKHPRKMSTKITKTMTNIYDNLVADVKLPDVKLPISNLPKFDFTIPPPQFANKSPQTHVKKPVSEPGSQSKEVAKKQPEQFNFSKPIIVSEKSRSVSSINNFKFSEPINAKSTTATKAALTFKVSESNTAPRKKTAAKNNGQNDAIFSLKPPAKLESGSVMDILNKEEKKKDDNLMDKFKPAVGTWECIACMVRNISTATRCIACETLKESPKKVEETNFGFGNKFKMTSDKWECAACLVRNNNSDTKCVSCTTPKPGAKSTVAPTPAKPLTSSDGFGDKFKPAAGTWECSACMLRNESDAIKCIACETPKSGAKIETKSTLVMPPEVKTNSGFGDLIKKQQSNWECPSCMVRNPTEKKSCVCCEAPKPGEKQDINIGNKSSSTTFKFGIDPSASSGFKFGIDKAAVPVTTFSFGIKPTETKTVKNVPIPATTGFIFGVPEISKTESVTVVSTNATIAITTSEANKPTTTFKFSSPALTKSTVSIFGTSTTTVTSTSGFTFGPTTSTTQSSPTQSIFSFGSPCTTSVVTTTIATPAATTTSSTSVQLGTVTSTSVTTTASSSSTLFNFTASSNPKPLVFGENKATVSQFNFGDLPFNPVFPSTKTVAPTNNTTSISFGSNQPNKTETTTTNPPGFSFSSGNNTTTNNNKPEAKQFSFTGSGEPATKTSAFSFSQNDNQTAAPLAKAPVYNFGASTATATSDAPAPNASNMFNFSANKSDKPITFGSGSSNVFGESSLPAPPPQNGGFNFGSNTVPISFNFGSGSNSATTPAGFGFGSSQAGSGSTVPPASASTTGIFAFGAGATQSTPAFSPDIKPNFNFTGGSLPPFTAQGAPSALPQRKIRKAMRRTQTR